MNKTIYKYDSCELYESQYDDCHFDTTKIVEAKYIKSIVKSDRGNPYIEALPYPRNDEDIMTAYSKALYMYNYDDIANMSKIEKMLQVSTLRQVRFPLPFHKSLEFAFYNALITSYRSRRRVIREDLIPIDAIDNSIDKTNYLLYGDDADATNAGFSLIGYSGCGKSSAMNSLLSRYPQVIIHNKGTLEQYIQIVYLVVNCIPNSNFAALYAGIGHAIDKAFGNTEPLYENEITKLSNLGKKMDKVREWIEKFSIGIIMFDEIQLINFDRTKESSYEALMILSNKTKVAMAVIGTEDARDKMFKELRTSRRIGTIINGNQYCDNKKFFSFLVNKLFQYQWFDEPVTVTEELVEALYSVTKGIVDQLIGIYSCMHYDYLERKIRPAIDASYVYEIAQKYYPGIHSVLAELESVDSARKLMAIRPDADVRVAALMDHIRQENESELLLQAPQKTTETILLKNVIVNISRIYDEYSPTDIEKAFRKIMKLAVSAAKTEKEITRDVLSVLKKKDNKKSSRKHSDLPDIDVSVMRTFNGVGEDEDV